jgi:hypothetical protein
MAEPGSVSVALIRHTGRPFEVRVTLHGHIDNTVMSLAEFEAHCRETFRIEADVARKQLATEQGYTDVYNRACEFDKREAYTNWAWGNATAALQRYKDTVAEISNLWENVHDVYIKCRYKGVQGHDMDGLVALSSEMSDFLCRSQAFAD